MCSWESPWLARWTRPRHWCAWRTRPAGTSMCWSVLEQVVYATYIDAIEQMLRSGEIGDVVMYDQATHELYDADSGDATAWRPDAEFPLGRLFDGGYHPIARLSRLFGPPATVYASGRRLRPAFGEFDHILMLFEYESGVRGTFSHGSVLSGRKDRLHIRGTQGVVSIERGQTVIDLNDGSSRTIPHARERDHAAMWRALLEAIAEGRDLYYAEERALQDLTTLLVIQRSAQENSKVRV